ncbi:MAG: hypothetical protein Q4A48_08370, partial [Bacillota bacterium]|nr:hypothetical protein [Bacillota bacterium]
ELASMFNAYCGYGETDHSVTQSFLGIPFETAAEFWRKSLQLYFNGADEDFLNEVERKAQVVGYARIMRRSIRRNGLNTEDGRKLIDNCRKNLAKLLPQVDSLLF